MNTKNRTRTVLTFAAVAMAFIAGAANAAVIFSDDFSGDATVDLNGTTPDVTTGGATWVATSNYKADGSFTLDAPATMSLAFTPVDGSVYTLDAQIEDLGGNHWAQLGFGNGQPTDALWSGRAWNLLRIASDTGNSHATYLKDLNGGAGWSSLGLLRYADDLDVRIVLDTTGGTGSWTATYYAKAGNVGTYTEVRSAVTLTDETIDSVGFSTYNAANEGKLNSFSLSDDTITDPNAPSVDAGIDMITWSGEPVALDATVVNNDSEDPQRTLSYLWSADVVSMDDTNLTIEITNADQEDATVEITKTAPTGGKTLVTMTLAVTLEGEGPVSDSMTIDVYDDSCQAAKSVGTVEIDPTDFDDNCITNLADFAVLAADWLVDYELTEPVIKP